MDELQIERAREDARRGRIDLAVKRAIERIDEIRDGEGPAELEGWDEVEQFHELACDYPEMEGLVQHAIRERILRGANGDIEDMEGALALCLLVPKPSDARTAVHREVLNLWATTKPWELTRYCAHQLGSGKLDDLFRDAGIASFVEWVLDARARVAESVRFTRMGDLLDVTVFLGTIGFAGAREALSVLEAELGERAVLRCIRRFAESGHHLPWADEIQGLDDGDSG